MKNKDKIITIILIVIIVTLICLFAIMSKSFSKYQTNVTGRLSSNIAFYLAKTDYQVKQINLTSLKPSKEPYVYNFTVGNQDGDKSSEVDISYVLKIVTTTNLPLRFKLYENEDYSQNGSTNLINSSNTIIEKDEYGTYFQTFTMEAENLLYMSPTTNNYTLLIYYDTDNKDAKYQDTIESIKIVVDSQQIIE